MKRADTEAPALMFPNRGTPGLRDLGTSLAYLLSSGRQPVSFEPSIQRRA